MQDFRPLEQKLAANLDWHGARIKFLARFMTALITTRAIPFQLRVKENFVVTARGRQMKLCQLFRGATQNRPLYFKRACQMWGAAYYFSRSRLPTGEYLIVVSPT